MNVIIEVILKCVNYTSHFKQCSVYIKMNNDRNKTNVNNNTALNTTTNTVINADSNVRARSYAHAVTNTNVNH